MSSSKDASFFNKFLQRFSGAPKKTAAITEKGSKLSKDESESVIPDITCNTVVTNSFNQSETLYRDPVLDNPGLFIEPIHSTSSFPLRTNQNLSTIREEDQSSNRMAIDLKSSGVSGNRLSNSEINFKDVLHSLHITNYLTPTYCDFCSKLLVGLIKQGLKCEICGMNFHKRCIPDMPKICNKQLNNMFVKQNAQSNSSFSSDPLKEMNMHIELDHSLIERQAFTSSRFASLCDVCQMEISNVKSYYECKDCHVFIHTKCRQKAKKNCRPIRKDDEDMDGISVCDSTDEMEDNGAIESDSDDDGESAKKECDTKKAHDSKKFIGLIRLSQRVKKTNECFWSGHMYYYTSKNTEPLIHYWQLDTKSIKIYNSYRLEKVLKEIPLETIKNAKLNGLNNKDENCINDQKCLYVLVASDEQYYCGMGNSDPNSTINVPARNFFNIFKMVYLPYMGHQGKRPSIKISAPKYEEKSVNEEFTINPHDLLGSGQFGQVYGGKCKASGKTVAIKVIDKTRFKDIQVGSSIFQNEITILYNLEHPGIIKLYALFDEVERLYIVTEKLATDMLEMILNRNPSRLSERIAKFIIYQILIALNYLHEKKIAHCDLKPENILLVENIDYPQVKMCDFGYAKIIGENSFRRSMVGTPAYSPPELKLKRLYNNSIDMWSMGVIVYVSLSGTFPFEEDRDINEQIRNSNFMFPENPWRLVDPRAIDLINKFLQVKIERRMSVKSALQHVWFDEDFQLYLDLFQLEKRLGVKWLTTKAQEDKWSQSIKL